MKQFISFVIKEAKHIVRDKRTMLILFGMPIVMMLLFGFAITNDIKNVRIIIVTSNADYATQQATDRLAASEFFTIAKVVATPSEAEQSIRNQEADMAIVFSQDFASKKSGFQLIVDGADPNMAQQWSNYASAVLMNPKENSINTKLLYNPQMKSAISAELAKLKAKGTEADSLRTECNTLRAARIETLVNAAVAEKKIGEDKKQQFLELGKKLGAEDLKATFDAMSPQVKLGSIVGNQGGAPSGGNAEYKKLSEVPTAKLEKLRTENPAQYRKLFKAEYGFECEI